MCNDYITLALNKTYKHCPVGVISLFDVMLGKYFINWFLFGLHNPPHFIIETMLCFGTLEEWTFDNLSGN